MLTVALMATAQAQSPSIEIRSGDIQKQFIAQGEKYCKDYKTLDEVVVRKDEIFVGKVEKNGYSGTIIPKVVIVFLCRDGYTFIASGPSIDKLLMIGVPPKKDVSPNKHLGPMF